MVPIDGEVREGVGLLGSPSFEIPRSVRAGQPVRPPAEGDELRRRLAAKNRYNLRTMGLFLFVRWLHFFVPHRCSSCVAVDLYDSFGHVGDRAPSSCSPPVQRRLLRPGGTLPDWFRRLRPRFCSIYDPYFWWHERFWKVPRGTSELFNGTPFKSLIWRLLGVRLGKRVFDDGCYLTERTLVTIGDDCTLNAQSKIQGHSQEDGTFKSDHITIGSGCTLGVGAFVHYGVTMGDARCSTDSFLMKGEEIPPGSRWSGNPAIEMRRIPTTTHRGSWSQGTASRSTRRARSGDGTPGPGGRSARARAMVRRDGDRRGTRCGNDYGGCDWSRPIAPRGPFSLPRSKVMTLGGINSMVFIHANGSQPGVLVRCTPNRRAHRDPALDRRSEGGASPSTTRQLTDSVVAALHRLADQLAVAPEFGAAGGTRQGARRVVRRA